MDGSDDIGAGVLRTLRVKGFASVGAIAECTGEPAGVLEPVLHELSARGHAQFMEARDCWRLTPAGRAAHDATLPGPPAEAVDALRRAYEGFLPLNVRFKELCS